MTPKLVEPQWLKLIYIKLNKLLTRGKRKLRLHQFEQERLALDLTLDVMEQSIRENMKTGSVLFYRLPDPAMPHMTGHPKQFDPYQKDLSKDEVYEWVKTHIRFDDQGKIATLYDTLGYAVWRRYGDWGNI